MKKSLILLSGLVAASVAPMQANPAPDRPAFSVRAECFVAFPGDQITTAETEKGRTVQWIIRYPQRQNRVLSKRISPGLLQDTSATSFWIRGEGRHELGLQLIEDNGRGFTELIHVHPSWTRIQLPYSGFQPNQEPAGKIDPGRINKLVLVDYAATLQPQKRGRTIWLTDWRFSR